MEHEGHAVERFGRLTTIRRVGSRGAKHEAVWLCRCDCGVSEERQIRHLRIARSNGKEPKCSSCYALQMKAQKAATLERRVRRGSKKYRPPGFWRWKAMKSRCHRPASKDYPRYGGRGIAVCERWRHSFKAFVEDMGQPPSPEHSLDRIDNNRGYEPGNVRWATRAEQQSNRTYRARLTHDGRAYTMSEAARATGLNVATLFRRIEAGWSTDRIMTTPARKKAPPASRLAG